MKTVTLQFVRYNLGAMLHEIRHHAKEYLITKSGKPIAKLTPTDDAQCLALMKQLKPIRK